MYGFDQTSVADIAKDVGVVTKDVGVVEGTINTISAASVRFDCRVLSYVSTISSSPTMILFILAGVMIVLGTLRLRQLEEENGKLKNADLSLDKEMLQDVIRRKL